MDNQTVKTSPRPSLVVKALNAISRGLMFAIPAVFVPGAGLLLVQGLEWLKTGTWAPITTFEMFHDLFSQDFVSWLRAPTDWLGMWKVVMFLLSAPAWLAMVLIGVAITPTLLGVSLAVSDLAEKLSPSKTTTDQNTEDVT